MADSSAPVLITGASSGVGLAAAEAIARRGASVVATVRNADDFAMIEGRFGALGLPVRPAYLDITDAKQAAEVIDEHRPGVLVNNAGDATFAPLLEVDDDDAIAQLDLLVVAPTRLVRLAATHMRAQGGGRIVNVSSALATVPLPSTGWYSASKAAISSLTETLRMELADHDITVIRVELGAIDTPIWDDASDATDKADGPSFGAVTGAVRPLFTDVEAAAATVARAACDEHPRALYRAGLGAHMLSVVARAPACLRDPALRLLLG